MTNISQQQARVRFKVIPPTLQEAILSVQTAEIIEVIAHKNYLSEQQTSTVASCVGYVLLGFIHPEDLLDEFSRQISMSPQAARGITDDLATRLFNPLKPDLDNAYAPLPHDSEAPTIIQEIKPPQAVPAPKPMGGPAIISQTFQAVPKPSSVPPVGVPPRPAAPTVPAPTAPLESIKSPFSEKGWSQKTQQEPVVRLGSITPGIPSPTQTPAANPLSQVRPVSIPPTPRQPTKGMGEFERRGLGAKANVIPQPTMPSPTLSVTPKLMSPSPVMPVKPAEAAPVMLHQVSTSAPIQQPSDLGYNTRSQNQITATARTTPTPTPVKAAVLELGSSSSPSQNNASQPAAAKVVHYSEYKTPIPAMPTNSGPRQVTEITATPSVRSMPAGQVTVPPPKPPTPPSPAFKQAQSGQVIVKDFLK